MAAFEASVPARRATGAGSRDRRAADWLGLAAAPTFALMALVTQFTPSGPADFLCLSAHDALPLDGMVLMYLLMSIFHLAPWLRLVGRRRPAL